MREYKSAEGAPIVCKTCHHFLKEDEPKKATPRLRCTKCHPPVGEPAANVDGKKAVPLATLEPSGKVYQKSVIFHKYCRDLCHRGIKVDGKSLFACRRCHEKGVGGR